MAVDVTYLNSNSVTNIDINFERTKEALEKALGREGDLPNHMETDLDMDGNDILNVGTIQANDITIDGNDATGILQLALEAVEDAEGFAEDSENSAIDSANSAAEAAGYAASLNLPAITAGTTNYQLNVNLDEDGYDLLPNSIRASFTTVTELLADTSLDYTRVNVGDIIEAQGFRYEVAASDATGFDEETAGGVKVNRVQDYDTEVELFGSYAAELGEGSIWTGGAYRYEEMPSDTPLAAPYISNQNNVIFKVLPDGRKAFITSAFGDGNLADTFAAATEAVLEARESSTFDVWFQDTPGIIIPPGVYNLDAPLEVELINNLTIHANGALIRQLTESFHAFKIVGSPLCEINGLAIDMRNNNVADEAILIAGQSSNVRFNGTRVQANSSNADFACVRMKQGDASGFTDDNRDKGNFWVHFEDFWCRKLSGGDANNIPTVFDLQGCQNAFSLANSKMSNFDNGILVRNQNESLASGISNSIHFYNDKFESYSGAALRLQADGGATISVAGGSMIGCRFEAGGAVAHSALSGSPVSPILLAGSTIISNVSAYVTGVTTDFNSLDSVVTPNFVAPRMTGSRPYKFYNIGGSVGASVEARARSTAAGGSYSIVRDDGTVDAMLSQRAGGGLQFSAPNGRYRFADAGLPTSAAGLGPGDIWRDAAAGNVIKVVV